ncbi:MAG: HlyD family efflux transporter periplasmic adaptor subunit [Verrucomicrobiia bacterium]
MSEVVPSGDRRSPTEGGQLALLDRPVDILKIEPDLARLAETRPGSTDDPIAQLLAYVVRLTNSRAALYLEPAPSTLRQTGAIWRDIPPDQRQTLSPLLHHIAADAVATAKSQIKPIPGLANHFGIAAPLIHENQPRGCVTILLAAQHAEQLQPYVVILQAVLGFFHYALLRRDTFHSAWLMDQSAALVELATRTAAAPYYQESVRILTSDLQTHLGCARVALGEVKGKQVKLSALSGIATFDRRGTAAIVLEGAMRETLLHGTTLHWPRDLTQRQGTELADVAHGELARLLELQKIISIPLAPPGASPTAVLTLMWNADHPPSPQTDRFLDAAHPFLAAWITTLRKSDPLDTRKWADHLWTRLGPRKKAILAGLALGAALLLAWPFPHHLRVDCRVEPALRRVVSAPFDGLLKKAHVEPGQPVERGALLATMDDKELQWKHAELLASRDRALRQRDLSMTDSDARIAQAQMAGLEAEALDLEIRLIENRKDNLELRAPIDGLVITGDLQRAEGAPVRQGQVLFEIAPPGNMIIELLIPARDISLVRDGAPVTVRLESFPGRQWHGQIQKILPQSEAKDGENFFRAEARINPGDDSAAWRAGMKGRAVVTGPHAPLAWLLTRRLWDFLHVSLFW